MTRLLCVLVAVFTVYVRALNIQVNNLDNAILISENSSLDTVIFTINATDLDPGDVLVYSLDYTDPASGPFIVNSSTGEVVVTHPGLNFESVTQYLLGINITDGNTTETGVLNVTVTDIDEPPVISVVPSFDVILDENITSSQVLFTVSASDPEGDSVNVSCSVVPDDGTFNCSSNGDISNIENPDFRYHYYVITITATSGPSEVSTVDLIVNITEYVNNPPYLLNLPNTTVVMEDVPVGTTIYDIGLHEEEGEPVTLNVTVSPSSEADTFNVTDAGEIILNKALDFETLTSYTLSFLACDPQQCRNLTTLTIVVADYLEGPVAHVVQTSISMPENAKPNVYQLPVSFNVSDPEGDTDFEYLLPFTAGSHNSYFRIDPDSGNITLKQAVDYEDTGTFPNHQMSLRVGVRDPSGKIGYVSMIVDITDVNDFAPVFTPAKYTGSVEENSPSGTSVLLLTALDLDGGDFGNVRYTVDEVGSPYFRVTSLSNGVGRLQTTSTPIDREAFPTGQITFTVRATDGQNTTEAEVTVNILDVNDNPPRFSQSEYSFTVRYDASAGTKVGQVTAVDPDSSSGNIGYTVSTNSSLFIVNWLDGQIFVQASDSLEPDTTYTFTVFAEDVENGGERSQVQVTVTTFTPQDVLVDWEIDSNGEYLGLDDIAKFERDLEATCTPCNPQVVEAFEHPDTGNWIFRVNIAGWTKQEQLDAYTTDGRRTPTELSAGLAPTGDVISINESFGDEDENWWLDTPEGNFVIALLCLLGAGLLTAAFVPFLDYVWWNRKAERRSFYDGPDEDPPKQQPSSTPPPGESDLPGTPQGTP